jgi:hypothetical protein
MSLDMGEVIDLTEKFIPRFDLFNINIKYSITQVLIEPGSLWTIDQEIYYYT